MPKTIFGNERTEYWNKIQASKNSVKDKLKAIEVLRHSYTDDETIREEKKKQVLKKLDSLEAVLKGLVTSS